ncbi:MAG: 50S ribosomal protein L4 [Candidatus Obscuribacterales bacterium]|nr:50S ribosomal protein L4 [Candidatus Obscuribacterales bacterium]
MTSVLVKDLKGNKVSERELADSVFGIEPNLAVVHQALVRQLANSRSGSANTKTRAEVRGGGRKPWRQKGTGRARAGSIRSPLWAGGGVIFGPKPRDYSKSMNKKARQLALRSALSARAADLVVVESFDSLFGKSGKDSAVVEQPKTKQMALALKDLGLQDKRLLLVLDRKQHGNLQVERAARNIAFVVVVDHTNLNIRDLAWCDNVLTTSAVIDQLEQRFETAGKSDAPKADKAPKAEKPVKAEPKAKTEKAAAEPKAAKPEKKAAEKTSEKKTETKSETKPASKKKAADKE